MSIQRAWNSMYMYVHCTGQRFSGPAYSSQRCVNCYWTGGYCWFKGKYIGIKNGISLNNQSRRASMTYFSDCALSVKLLTSWFMNMFLTVSGPIKAILASFNVLVSHLLRRRRGETRLCYASRRKSAKLSSFSFNRSKTSLELRPKISLPWKCQFSSKHQVMTSRRREMWQKNLTLALPWIGSSSYCSYRWPLLLA